MTLNYFQRVCLELSACISKFWGLINKIKSKLHLNRTLKKLSGCHWSTQYVWYIDEVTVATEENIKIFYHSDIEHEVSTFWLLRKHFWSEHLTYIAVSLPVFWSRVLACSPMNVTVYKSEPVNKIWIEGVYQVLPVPARQNYESKGSKGPHLRPLTRLMILGPVKDTYKKSILY